MDRILRDVVIYDRLRWWTCLRLEERSPRLERKIKRAILVVLLALFGGVLYTLVNAFLVLKPFIFNSSLYQQLEKQNLAQYNLLSVTSVTSKSQSDQILKIIKENPVSIFIATEVSQSSGLISELNKNFASVIQSSDKDSTRVVLATKFGILSTKEIGVDIPPGLIVETSNPKINIAVCNPDKIIDKYTNSQAKMALRRIATAMRHSHENWLVVCRIGGSIFSPLYQKFIEATNYASNQLETPNKFGLSELEIFNTDAKNKKPLQVFSKGQIAVKLRDKFPIEDSQDAIFSSFLTSSQALSSSSKE